MQTEPVRGQVPTRDEITILFTDIIDSTPMTASLGDEQALEVTDAHFAVLHETLAKFDGTAIDAVGDALLASFNTAPAAVQCAIAMHDAIFRAEPDFGGWPLAIRIGIHHGTGLVLDGRLFGDVINTGSRIAALAGGQEIMCTRGVFERLPDDLAKRFEYEAPIIPRGKRSVLEVFGWSSPFKQESIQTFVVGAEINPSGWAPRDSFLLTVIDDQGGEQQRRVVDSPLFVGRTPENEISVPSRMVSKTHLAFSVIRQNLWVFDMESSNGVFVRYPDLHGDEHRVQHQAPLTIGCTGRFGNATFRCEATED